MLPLRPFGTFLTRQHSKTFQKECGVLASIRPSQHHRDFRLGRVCLCGTGEHSRAADQAPRPITEDRLELLEGPYVLTVTAPGYAKATVPADIEAGKTREIALEL